MEPRTFEQWCNNQKDLLGNECIIDNIKESLESLLKNKYASKTKKTKATEMLAELEVLYIISILGKVGNVIIEEKFFDCGFRAHQNDHWSGGWIRLTLFGIRLNLTLLWDKTSAVTTGQTDDEEDEEDEDESTSVEHEVDFINLIFRKKCGELLKNWDNLSKTTKVAISTIFNPQFC
ncbi:hypothetical protein G9A89_017571 [Geosiphon pyriformis]|nr:hypothetical protein G9A89_017571 [Geosiphon pyriformis]